jgi:hypothetical protein
VRARARARARRNTERVFKEKEKLVMGPYGGLTPGQTG